MSDSESNNQAEWHFRNLPPSGQQQVYSALASILRRKRERLSLCAPVLRRGETGQQAGQGACLAGGYRIPGGFAKLLGHGRAIKNLTLNQGEQ